MASIYLNSMVCGANGYKKNRNVSGILFVRNITGKCSAQLPRQTDVGQAKQEHTKQDKINKYFT